MNDASTAPFFNEFAQFRRVRRAILWIFLVALALRLGLFAVGMMHADARGDHPAFYGLDARQYLRPARSLLDHGTYSIESDGKQVPYITRSAGYPWFIVTCLKTMGDRVSSIILPQLVLGALSCCIVYWIAAMLFQHRAGVLTGLLMAFDQNGIAYANKVMTETLCVSLLSASILLLLLFLAHKKNWLLWLSGISLGLCTLAHGSTLYLGVVPVVVLAILGTDWKQRLSWTTIFIAAFLMTTAIWQVRNYKMFRIYQLSPKSAVIATTATRVLWYDEPSRTWDEVADEWYLRADQSFGRKIGTPREQWKDWDSEEIRHRYYPAFVDHMNQEARAVFRAHFRTYSRMVFYSFVKMSLFPLPYAEFCRYAMSTKPEEQKEDLRSQVKAAFRRLLRGELGTFWQQAKHFPLCKVTGFGWNAAYWFITVPASFVGAWIIIRRYPVVYTILLLGGVAYFWVTTPIVMAGDGMNRYRLRSLPFFYCVVAAAWLGRKRGIPSAHGNPNVVQRVMAGMHAPIYWARIEELVRQITPHLRQGDRVLDVGCGSGTLGKALLDSASRLNELCVEGIERVKRGGEQIVVHEYNGPRLPLPDRSYDVVIVADVLHHDTDPERLLRECIRVSRRLVIVKDHQLAGPFSKLRVSFLDWAANAPYGVPCLFRYNTPHEWAELSKRLNLSIKHELKSMNLYPPVVNLIFGGRLHYFVVYKVSE